MVKRLLARRAAWGARFRTALLSLAYRDFLPGAGVHLGAGCRLRAIHGGTVEIGARCVAEPGCTIVARSGRLTIGPDAFIGKCSVITAVERVTIGRDALIAEQVTIRDQDHDYTKSCPYRTAGMLIAPVEIGNNVWIGAKATVTRGVTIGDNSVIGANSVVTSNIPANTIAAGVPARVIRMIGDGA